MADRNRTGTIGTVPVEDRESKKSGAAQSTNRITGRARWWALGAVLLTMLFASLYQTIVSTAMPSMIADLEGFDIYAWVFTAYMMTSAITVPIYGKLSDIYGRKPFYIFGITVFLIGSVLSGQAQTMLQLILARGLQGIGGGAMLSMPRATIGDIFNPRERGRWMGVISAVFGVSSIIGPTLGGWITDNWGWRWVFYVNIPFGLLVLVAIIFTLPSVRTEVKAKLDWSGSLLLALGLVPLLLAFTWAGSRYPWGSPTVLTLFAAGLVFIGLFVLNERRVSEPIIDPGLFTNPIFATTIVIALFVTMAMFGTLMFLPLFVQGVVGLSAQDSGLVLSPMMISFVIASILGGQVMTRTGRYKLQAVIGGFLLVVGMIAFNAMSVDTGWPAVVRNMILIGLGIGTLLPLLNVAVQNAFPYRIMGVVNATQQFVRSLGGVIIAPILGTVLARGFTTTFEARVPDELRQVLDSLPPQQQQALANPQGLITAQAQEAIAERFATVPQGQALYEQFIQAVREGLAAGMDSIFLVGLVVAVLAFIGTFFLREVNLQTDEFFEEASKPTDGD